MECSEKGFWYFQASVNVKLTVEFVFRMESFVAEFCDEKSYRKASEGFKFVKKRKLFDDFIRFKTEAKKPKLASLSFEVSFFGEFDDNQIFS